MLLHSSRLLVGIIDVTQGKKARLAQESSERKYRDLFHFLPVALLRLEGHKLVDIYQDARAAGVEDFEEYLRQQPKVFAQALERAEDRGGQPARRGDASRRNRRGVAGAP